MQDTPTKERKVVFDMFFAGSSSILTALDALCDALATFNLCEEESARLCALIEGRAAQERGRE